MIKIKQDFVSSSVEIPLNYIGNGYFRVMEDLSFRGIVVPKNFVTDLDTVPRIPVVYALYKNRAVISPIFHDYLYSIKAGKEYADQIFKELMAIEDVDDEYRKPIYWGVKFFGGRNYEKTKSNKPE